MSDDAKREARSSPVSEHVWLRVMVPLAPHAAADVVAELDGRTIRIDAREWQVTSREHRMDGHRWVQICLAGEPSYAVLLKMAGSAQACDAILALEWWLADPGHEDGDVIEVE